MDHKRGGTYGKKLNEAVAALRPQMVAALQRLVRRRSVEADPLPGKPFGEEVDACFAEALTLCRELGFETTDMDRYIGWCGIGTGDEMVAVLGHLDVVPEGEGWHHPPYAAEIEGGRLYGRGAIDDKGPVVASLFALKAIRDLGIPLNRRVRLLFGLNEETNDRDVLYYKAHGGEIPVLGFTPDGEYPLINGEKGILNGTYSRKLHQTGDYRLTKFEGGAASNISPAYAAAELQCPADAAAKISADKVTVTPIEGGIRVEAEGIAVHGSTPEQGENAIGRLAQALNQLPLTGELGDCMAFVAERLGMEVHGESLGLAMRDELSGPLTLNLGVAKFEQETLSLVFSVRYPVTLKYERVYPRLSRGFTLGGFTETEMTHAAAIYMPPESELIRRLSKVYEEQTGKKAELKSIGGGTYAKSMPNLVAFGPIFPGDEVREHKPDEYMEIERVLQNAEIIAAAMYELAK